MLVLFLAVEAAQLPSPDTPRLLLFIPSLSWLGAGCGDHGYVAQAGPG
jgi:hypothetical protein